MLQLNQNMKRWLQDPEIYKISAVLTAINMACLIVSLTQGNLPGIIINGAFLVFNSATTAGNYLLRGYRSARLKSVERQHLIQLTIGKE